jgi:hypothetical protein
MMNTSMGWEYVSELRPLTGLLFIPQMVYEHGQPRWNNIGRGQRMIRTPELSDNHISSHLVTKREELGEINDKFGLAKCFFFP